MFSFHRRENSQVGFCGVFPVEECRMKLKKQAPLAKPACQHPGEEEKQSAKHQHHATKMRDANSPRDFRKLNKGSHGGRYMG